MTNKRKTRDEDPDRLRQRLAEIQFERAHILDGTWDYPVDDEDYGGARLDALYDLAREEGRIREALDLAPGDWDAGVWPDWIGWSLLTLVVVSIFLLAWMAR